MIAVIVVIGLVMVSLISTLVSSPSTTISNSSTKLSQSSGGISILDSVVDLNGRGLVSLSNNTGGTFSITHITADGIDSNYGTGYSLPHGSKKSFELNSIGNACACLSSDLGKSKTCNITIYGLSEYGLEKKVSMQISVNCISDANQTDQVNIVPVIIPDTTSPVVYLSSPATGTASASRTIDFNFNVTDASTISRCELFISGVSDTNKTTGLVSGVNTINKIFSSDLYFDWNVTCYDSSLNKGDSNSTWRLDVNADPLQITTCTELQNISANRSGAYTLMNDINCYGTNTWNSSAGFIPVSGVGPNGTYDGGGDDIPFTGSLTGGNHTISGLVINRSATSYQALFGLNDSSASVSGVKLVDTNVWGNWFSGGLVGMNRGSSTITNCSFSGNVVGNSAGYDQGGVFGGNWGTVSSSFSTGIVSGGTYVGGLGGIINGTGTVINCYSTSAVSGISSVGGLIGYNSGTSAATRLSYATGNVTSTGANVGGLVGYNFQGNVLYDFSTGRVTGGSVAGGLIGSHSPGTITLGRWYDVVGDSASTCYSGGGTGCTTITDAMGGVSAFYYDANAPISSWGTWNLVSGNKYSTGTWSICRGASYPWLTWENRTC
jgi:hypothetical protein